MTGQPSLVTICKEKNHNSRKESVYQKRDIKDDHSSEPNAILTNRFFYTASENL